MTEQRPNIDFKERTVSICNVCGEVFEVDDLEGKRYHIGEHNDVLDRYYDAKEKYDNAYFMNPRDYFIRVTEVATTDDVKDVCIHHDIGCKDYSESNCLIIWEFESVLAHGRYEKKEEEE